MRIEDMLNELREIQIMICSEPNLDAEKRNDYLNVLRKLRELIALKNEESQKNDTITMAAHSVGGMIVR